MEQYIQCGDIAENPLYVKELGIHIYTAEEFCYYIFNNTYPIKLKRKKVFQGAVFQEGFSDARYDRPTNTRKEQEAWTIAMNGRSRWIPATSSCCGSGCGR